MGNEIPWSQIHPTIKSETPYVGIIMIDPERRLCITELVELEPEQLSTGEAAAPELIAATQVAAARLASSYRTRRRQDTQWRGAAAVPVKRTAAAASLKDLPSSPFKVLKGGMS